MIEELAPKPAGRPKEKSNEERERLEELEKLRKGERAPSGEDRELRTPPGSGGRSLAWPDEAAEADWPEFEIDDVEVVFDDFEE